MDDLKDDFVKPLVYRKTYNMFVRPNTSDDLVCDEAQDYNNLFINVKPYDVFVDVGSNIGAVSKLAKDIEENLTILCYEPDKENFDVLVNNLHSECNVSLIESALGTGEKEVNFYQANGSNKGKHSTVCRSSNTKKSIKINQLDFRKEIEDYNCTLLKCDIEGGEYNLDLCSLPDKIKGLAIEFHLINNNYLQMLTLYKIIKNQFGLVLGDKPEEETIEYFKEAYNEDDSAFMCIFLRDEK